MRFGKGQVRGKYIRPVLWERYSSPEFSFEERGMREVLCVSLKPMLRKTRLSRVDVLEEK